MNLSKWIVFVCCICLFSCSNSSNAVDNFSNGSGSEQQNTNGQKMSDNVLNADADNVLDVINSIDKNCRLVITGVLTNDLITKIANKMNGLYQKDNEIRIDLDITKTTGLQDLSKGFSSVRSLKSISLPATVNKFSPAAFYGCLNLEFITVDLNSENYKSIDGVLFSKDGKTLVMYPIGKKGSSYNIPNFVTDIGVLSFRQSSLESLQIPANVTIIKDHALSECRNLKKLYISNGLTSMEYGAEALRGCVSLEEVITDSNNEYYKSIDGVLFTKDGKQIVCYPAAKTQSEYEVPTGVESIGICAFYSCSNIVNISLPDSVNYLNNDAFNRCEKLKKIQIPNSVKRLGFQAFSCCYSLESVNIPTSVSDIEYHCFYGCKSLQTIVIPASVKIIATAFDDCENLASAVFQNPNGWKTSDQSISKDILSNPSKAASYLSKVLPYRWTRE